MFLFPNFSIFSIISFLILFTLAFSSEFLDQKLNSTKNQDTYEPNSQKSSSLTEVPIYMDEFDQYYVNITWKNMSGGGRYYEYGNNSSGEKIESEDRDIYTGKMLLSLYSSAAFVSSCPDLLPYECAKFGCKLEHTPANKSYLYSGMKVKGQSASISFELAGFCVINYGVIYADVCDPGIPANISGFLSLGHYLNALKGMNNDFSLFLSPDKEKAQSALYLGGDNEVHIDKSDNYMFTASTDENWMMEISSIQIQPVDKSKKPIVYIGLLSSFMTLFDINTDAIVFNVPLFKNITSILAGYGLQCSPDNYKPFCYYAGDINVLPTINFIVTGESSNMLEVKPEIYLKKHQNNISYSLQFASATHYPTNTLVINPDYENAIIFGRPFLSYYYIHFSGSQGSYNSQQVIIRVANHNKNSHQSEFSDIFPFIMISVLIITILVIAAVSYFFCKAKGKKGEGKHKKIKPCKEIQDIAESSSNVLFTKASTGKCNIKAMLKGKKERDNGRHPVSIQDLEYIPPDSFVDKTSDVTSEKYMQAHTYQKKNYNRLYENSSYGHSVNGSNLGDF